MRTLSSLSRIYRQCHTYGRHQSVTVLVPEVVAMVRPSGEITGLASYVLRKDSTLVPSRQFQTSPLVTSMVPSAEKARRRRRSGVADERKT